MDTDAAPPKPRPPRERFKRRDETPAPDEFSTQELNAGLLKAGHMALEGDQLLPPTIGSRRHPTTWMVWGLLLLANVFSAGLLLGRTLKPRAVTTAPAPPVAPVTVVPSGPSAALSETGSPGLGPAILPGPPRPAVVVRPARPTAQNPPRQAAPLRPITSSRPRTVARLRSRRKTRGERTPSQVRRPVAAPERPTRVRRESVRVRRVPRRAPRRPPSNWEGYDRTVLRALDRLP